MRSSLNRTHGNSKVTPDGRARNHLKEAAASTRDGVYELGSAAKELAASEISRIGDRVADLRETALEKVTRKPLASVLVAAGAGLLFGLLLRRR